MVCFYQVATFILRDWGKVLFPDFMSMAERASFEHNWDSPCFREEVGGTILVKESKFTGWRMRLPRLDKGRLQKRAFFVK